MDERGLHVVIDLTDVVMDLIHVVIDLRATLSRPTHVCLTRNACVSHTCIPDATPMCLIHTYLISVLDSLDMCAVVTPPHLALCRGRGRQEVKRILRVGGVCVHRCG